MKNRSVGDIVLMSDVCHCQDLPAKYRPSNFGIIVSVQKHTTCPLYAIVDTSRDIRLTWYSNELSLKTEVKHVPHDVQEELETRLIQYRRAGFDPWFYT